MKWYLLTASHANPGDQFARLGIERIIKHVDPDATFYRVCKHRSAVHERVECDRVVVCGMPLAWSRDVDAPWREHWWGALTGWMAEKPMILAGVGSFGRYPNPSFTFEDRLVLEMKRLTTKCNSSYCRDSIFGEKFGLPVHSCPSIFALMDYDIKPELNLCNFMDDGSHYSGYNPTESQIWKEIRGSVAKQLQDYGYHFIAHSEAEKELGENLGFEIIHAYGDFPETLLSIYARCKSYVGNRVHGAIVSASAGADVLCCGFDSRLYAVKQAGGKICTPKELLDLLQGYLAEPKHQNALDIDKEWQEQLKYFTKI